MYLFQSCSISLKVFQVCLHDACSQYPLLEILMHYKHANLLICIHSVMVNVNVVILTLHLKCKHCLAMYTQLSACLIQSNQANGIHNGTDRVC